MELTKSELQEWAGQLATESLLQRLRESKQETLEMWGREAFVGESSHETSVKNAKALGGLQVLEDLIELIEYRKKGEGE